MKATLRHSKYIFAQWRAEKWKININRRRERRRSEKEREKEIWFPTCF